MASKLPEEVIRETPDVPWDEVRGMRIVVDHVYHAVDYRIVSQTLQDDVPKLGLAIERWRSQRPKIGIDMEGPGLGL